MELTVRLIQEGRKVAKKGGKNESEFTFEKQEVWILQVHFYTDFLKKCIGNSFGDLQQFENHFL